MDQLDYQNAGDTRAERQDQFRRRLFGPSLAERWQAAAEAVGGQIVPGRFGGPGAIRVAVAGRPAAVEAVVNTEGAQATTLLRVGYVRRDRFWLAVRPADFRSVVGEMFGLSDVRVGDALFDEAFVLKGSDRGRVAAVFDDPTIRGRFRRLLDLRLTAGTRGSAGRSELRAEVPELLTDPNRLRALIDVADVVLARLEAVAG